MPDGFFRWREHGGIAGDMPIDQIYTDRDMILGKQIYLNTLKFQADEVINQTTIRFVFFAYQGIRSVPTVKHPAVPEPQPPESPPRKPTPQPIHPFP